MRKTLVSSKSAGIALGLALAATGLLSAQGPPSIEGKMAEEVYKNIQVLKGTPADQVNQGMHLIKGDLGVECEYCHVAGAFDKDDLKPKGTARKMMQMVIDLNKNNFDGKQVVTCYTCHRGHAEPVNTLLLPANQPKEEEKLTLPSADQILTKYVQALGGEQAIRKITSRIMTGVQMIPAGPGGSMPIPGTVERDTKAPNLTVNFYRAQPYTLSEGFDGASAWAQDQRGRVTAPMMPDATRAKRDADFYQPLNLKQQYSKFEVRGIESVNEHDAYVVVATPPNDLPEELYFDIGTGLLVRKHTVVPTAVGLSPFEVDYLDYRDAGHGVKVPYKMIFDPPGQRTEPVEPITVRIDKVQENVAIDDAKFAKPASVPPPPPAPK